jgi:hypothetical protein
MRAVLVVLLIFICTCSIAQHAVSKSNKCKIALPDNWLRNRSLIKHLITIAPSVFPKLQDKQLCLNCKAAYTLMFFYDSVTVGNKTPVTLASTGGSENYECVTTFYFRGTWVLMHKDTAIAELEVVSPEEEVTSRKKFSLPKAIATWNDGQLSYWPNPDDNPSHYISVNKDHFNPTVDDILRIIADKVRKIRVK